MALLLVCPTEFQCAPKILATLIAKNPILKGKKWDVNSSGDQRCLYYAESLRDQFGTQLCVDYRWDERHSGVSLEPRRLLSARYITGWFSSEDDSAFNSRLGEVATMKTPNRLVLCPRTIMNMFSLVSTQDPVTIFDCVVTDSGIIPNEFVSLREMEECVRMETEPQPLREEVKRAAEERRKPDVTELSQRIVGTVAGALQGVKAGVSESPDYTSLFASLHSQINTELQQIIAQLDSHYSNGLSQATASLQEAASKQTEEFTAKMNEMKMRIQALEAQQKDAIAQVEALKKSLVSNADVVTSSEKINKQIGELESAAKQYDRKVKLLYEGLPAGKKQRKPPPLTIELDEEGSRIQVTNRKKYSIECVKMMLAVERKAPISISEQAYPPGMTSVELILPVDLHESATIMMKQNEVEVANSLLVEFQDNPALLQDHEIPQPSSLKLGAPVNPPLDLKQPSTVNSGQIQAPPFAPKIFSHPSGPFPPPKVGFNPQALQPAAPKFTSVTNPLPNKAGIFSKGGAGRLIFASAYNEEERKMIGEVEMLLGKVPPGKNQRIVELVKDASFRAKGAAYIAGIIKNE